MTKMMMISLLRERDKDNDLGRVSEYILTDQCRGGSQIQPMIIPESDDEIFYDY